MALQGITVLTCEVSDLVYQIFSVLNFVYVCSSFFLITSSVLMMLQIVYPKPFFPNPVVPSAYEESTNHELKSYEVLNHEWDYIRSLSLFRYGRCEPLC